MRQTWRWFGPRDLTSVDDMRQAGVEGVVSALHHVATGAVWTTEDIRKRQDEIGRMKDGPPSGLAWEVVESLPVSEDIKKQKGDWRGHIANYKQSLANLAESGLETICYNFMPVLDWTRTDLAYRGRSWRHLHAVRPDRLRRLRHPYPQAHRRCRELWARGC